MGPAAPHEDARPREEAAPLPRGGEGVEVGPDPAEVVARALVEAGAAAAELRRLLEAERRRSRELEQKVDELQGGIVAERNTRVRLQHELSNAAAGRPFNPEVR